MKDLPAERYKNLLYACRTWVCCLSKDCLANPGEVWTKGTMEWSKRAGCPWTPNSGASPWNFRRATELGYCSSYAFFNDACPVCFNTLSSEAPLRCGFILPRQINEGWCFQVLAEPWWQSLLITSFVCLCAVSFAKRLAQEFPTWQVSLLAVIVYVCHYMWPILDDFVHHEFEEVICPFGFVLN